MTLDETLTAIEAVESKATKGPWKRDPYDRPHSQVIAAGNEVIVYHGRHNRQVDSQVVPNHDLIAHSRNILPHLLRLVRRLKEENAAWREADAHCDMLGYLAGDHEPSFDPEGYGRREAIRRERAATDLATADLVKAWEVGK